MLITVHDTIGCGLQVIIFDEYLREDELVADPLDVAVCAAKVESLLPPSHPHIQVRHLWGRKAVGFMMGLCLCSVLLCVMLWCETRVPRILCAMVPPRRCSLLNPNFSSVVAQRQATQMMLC